ncbi:DUF6230 family protein [Streptacidiphilus sp. EB129]|jgi:hypothetical protein|uniref:DUF6230 family protein n=1 Tax=Streptacidiphilus sp. EB129 TaxID=3156262 RepID=UPI003516EFC6
MSQTYGKTRWKRFAVVMVPTIAATAAVGVSIAQGALAASFSVSGVQAKVTAGELDGTGFTQYGTVDFHNAKDPKTGFPVAVSGFTSATIKSLCQSVPVSTPFGTYTLTIHAGDDPANPVTAKQIFLDMTDLQAKTATFTNINIGVAVGGITKGPVNPQDAGKTDPTGFAQEADSATLTGVVQQSWATSAGTFSLNGMHLSLASGDSPCPSP